MKVEIEKSEYDRLKSREEKYLAYMDMLSYRGEDKTYVDALCGKVAELEEENRKLKEELRIRKLTAKDYTRQQGVELKDIDTDLL